MISIITPVFNGASFIRKNIESIQQLSIPYEHIIVDGGSTDGTLEIINEYSSIQLLHQTEKTGMYGAIDMGFRVAKGEYICWINCDDQIIPNEYEKLYSFSLKGGYDFVCSDGMFHYLDTNKFLRIKGTRFVKYFLRKGFFPFSQPSVIYSKSLYYEVNGLKFNEYKITGDGDLFHRMSRLKRSKFGYLPNCTSIFLKHGNSLGDNNSEIAIIELKKNLLRPKATLINRVFLKILRVFSI